VGEPGCQRTCLTSTLGLHRKNLSSSTRHLQQSEPLHFAPEALRKAGTQPCIQNYTCHNLNQFNELHILAISLTKIQWGKTGSFHSVLVTVAQGKNKRWIITNTVLKTLGQSSLYTTLIKCMYNQLATYLSLYYHPQALPRMQTSDYVGGLCVSI
jgi:hypothetical protein